MSQDNTNGVQTASPTEHMVPKERLDELIADRRRLEEQLNVMQHVVRQAVPQQAPQAPEVEPEFLVRLKDQNPEAYQAFKLAEHRSKQQGAATFQIMDSMDQMKFAQVFGEEGQKYSNQVEAKLQELRSRGIHYDRGQIFVHLKGQESIQASKAPKPAPVASAPIPPVVNSNVPSSDPSNAATTAGGSATATSGRKTIQEMEQELANFKF